MNKYSNHPPKKNTQTYSHVYDDKFDFTSQKNAKTIEFTTGDKLTMVNGRTYMKQVKN